MHLLYTIETERTKIGWVKENTSSHHQLVYAYNVEACVHIVIIMLYICLSLTDQVEALVYTYIHAYTNKYKCLKDPATVSSLLMLQQLKKIIHPFIHNVLFVSFHS